MPQGGFGRDFQQLTQLQHRAAQKQLEIQRIKIGKEVLENVQPQLKDEMKKIKTQVIEKYEDSLQELSQAVRQRDKTLKFLIYVSYGCLAAATFLMGYLSSHWM
tara:strand:+ start:14580 stop:14891 length:312 start_codon:yes stop_codon:yes gene_type:complete